MAVEIPSVLVDFILFGFEDDRRQLQESPILGDVWTAFARKPDGRQDLLIQPHKSQTASRVASELARRLRDYDGALEARERKGRGRTDTAAVVDGERNIAYLQGIVAARLSFQELFEVIVPMTPWWADNRVQEQLKDYNFAQLAGTVDSIVSAAQALTAQGTRPPPTRLYVSPLDRYVTLAGIVNWAATALPPPRTKLTFDKLLDLIKGEAVAQPLELVFARVQNTAVPREKLIWQVSLNRPVTAALERSVPAVKGDAARTLFKVRCSEITWAVVDSGIDANHPVFNENANGQGRCRVIKTFDFSKIRKIISLDNLDDRVRKKRVEELMEGELLNKPSRAEAEEYLEEVAKDADRGRPVQWALIDKFVEMGSLNNPPESGHGTHVAGIIGARKVDDQFADGMCPDINLYDVRVLSRSVEDTEFAIIAALQYLRYINERHNFITVHGANLSLSIPHDVRNFACGRTPVCNECERLIDSGVVVVAAAGNRGYHRYETGDGGYEGYAAFSITDPGNTDGVITVGATHRYWPHTYGVSFFSSRGPTGDGRMKPDLVAPGERIEGPLPGGNWGQQDGTSMAAPHVSGAAAMLMARYSELIGNPRRIKKIICESATDLDRDRSFQGAGMLDVLRALQSI